MLELIILLALAGFVIARGVSKEKEFDYPSGDENVYVNYSGDGGVEVSSFWRKLIYGWKYGGTRFLWTGCR